MLHYRITEYARVTVTQRLCCTLSSLRQRHFTTFEIHQKWTVAHG